MQVIIFSKKIKTKDLPFVQELFDVLAEYQINAYVYHSYFEQIKDLIEFKRDVGIFEGAIDFSIKKFDFFITLGGDGTILEAVTHIQKNE